METKICSCCGNELPINQFQTWVRKDGTLGVLHQCLKCQRRKANKKFYEKNKIGELSKFDDDILINELKRRGLITINNKDAYGI